MHKSKVLAILLSLLLYSSLFGAQSPPRKVGLVLSGGGARGAAHVGVLKVLEREGIPIDYIAGSSFGALVGGLYAVGHSAGDIERILTSQDWTSLFNDAPERQLSPLMERKGFRYQGQLNFEGFAPELPTGLWTGQKITEALNDLTTPGMIAADYDFDRLRIPFRAVATNLLDGKAYIFRKGSMAQALRASFAIPMLFTPVERDGMLLVDGGLADNLPCDVAREMGSDIVIAVDVTTLLKKDRIRNFINVVDQSISLLMYQNAQANTKLADLIVRPGLDDYTATDYAKVAEIIKRGEKEAEERIAAIRELTSDLPRRSPPGPPKLEKPAVISKVSFEGLKRVTSRQLAGQARTRPGQTVDAKTLGKDLSRLYATRLFDNVGYNLKRQADDRYQLEYVCREAPLHTLGTSIRFDRDYSFVALAEFTARQLFDSPSTFTLSSQFGGFEEHSASLRYIDPHLPFLYIEPKVHISRRERLDIRDENLVDKFTDKRIGGELMLGGTFLNRFDLAFGYRDDRVSIGGGSEPRRLTGYQRLAGFTASLKRDSLDAQEFPTRGILFDFQLDKRSEALGGDLNYSKWHGDLQQYISISDKTAIGLQAGAGYSRGDVPFYDQFFAGGFNWSAGASAHLLGYSRDELVGRQMALAGISYRRIIFMRPLSFIRRGYATGIYNIAGISQSPAPPYRAKYYNGAGIGIAFDSLLGPLRIMAGLGQSARFNLYVSLGPGF